MELGCGAKCAKLLLFCFNTILMISSVALLALGIYYLVEDERASLFRLFSTPKYNYALLQFLAWAFVFIGAVIFVVSCCGCCGTIKNNRCLLVVYTICLMVTFAMELTAGILAISFQEKVIAELKVDLGSKLQNEYGVHSSFTAAIDLVQTKFECCGINSSAEYETSTWFMENLSGVRLRVSRTCCKLANRHEPQSHVNPRPLNETLCQSQYEDEYLKFRNQEKHLERFIQTESGMFVLLGCGLAALSLLGIIISICFCRSVRPAHRNKI